MHSRNLKELVEETLASKGHIPAVETPDRHGYYVDQSGEVPVSNVSELVVLRFEAYGYHGTGMQKQRLWMEIQDTLTEAGFKAERGEDLIGPYLKVTDRRETAS